MAAYMIVQARIANEGDYNVYRKAVVPIIENFGGKIIRDEKPELMEGEIDQSPPTLVKFPSMSEFKAFWNSSEYAKIKSLRESAADLTVWALS